MTDLPVTVVCYDPQQPDQACPICRGMGMIARDVPPGHPDFGRLFRCPNYTPDVDHDRRESLRKLSNLSALSDRTLANFHMRDNLPQDQQRIVTIARDTAAQFTPRQNSRFWILFEGSYGSGKTHLAAAIGNAWLAFGEPVLFITAPDLLDHLRNTFSPQSEIGYSDLFERVKNVSLLILDDLGTENPSPWATEKLFQLLNYRYENKKYTIITTNVDINNLDPRLRSRLLDTDIVTRISMHIDDYRSAIVNMQSALPSALSDYQDYRFSTFETASVLEAKERENIERALQICSSYAEKPQGWLMLMGEHGTGKTHLAAAIANVRIEYGDDVMFASVSDLMDFLRVTFSPGSPVSFDQRFKQIRESDLLVLDHMLGSSRSEWVNEKLFQLIEYRYVKKLPTVITTTYGLEALSAALRSRLLDKRFCTAFALRVTPYVERVRQK